MLRHISFDCSRYTGDLRLVFYLFAVARSVLAQSYEAVPAPPQQGDTLRLRAPAAAQSARMNGRTVRLFRDGSVREGLMPVPAQERPGTYKLEFLDGGGAVVNARDVVVRDAHFPRQSIRMTQETAALKADPGEAEAADAFRKTVTEIRFWTEPFTVPVPGCRTSPYGVGRVVNGKLTGNYHAGYDQRGAAGTPVRAVAAGVVRIARKWTLHGNTIGIDHGQGLLSMYLHLSRFAVAEGAEVKRGDVVGYVGTTGRSTAPHLHWSLYANGIPVNPGQWVKVAACPVKK